MLQGQSVWMLTAGIGSVKATSSPSPFMPDAVQAVSCST